MRNRRLERRQEEVDIAHALIRIGTRLSGAGIEMLQGRHTYDPKVQADLARIYWDIQDVLARYATKRDGQSDTES